MLCSATAPVHAQDQDTRERAHTAFSAGVQAYQAGHFEDALRHFQDAYRIAPSPVVRVNVANCYQQLGKPVEALFYFERFLAETGEHGSAQQRAQVRQAVAHLEQQVGEVTLRVAPDGATVTIDHSESRRAPIMDTIRLAAGHHTIDVSMDGYRSVHQNLDVRGGSRPDLQHLARAGRGHARSGSRHDGRSGGEHHHGEHRVGLPPRERRGTGGEHGRAHEHHRHERAWGHRC